MERLAANKKEAIRREVILSATFNKFGASFKFTPILDSPATSILLSDLY